MIYVTQGHEDGIGLEVFLKSYLCLNSMNQKKFILVSNKKSLNSVLSKNNLKHPKNLTVFFTDNTQIHRHSSYEFSYFENY